MKNIILILVLIIFQSYLLFAVEKDSTVVTGQDSLTWLNAKRESIKENQDDDNWFYWTGVVGLGSTLGSAYNFHWTNRWYNGPVASLGLELSFSSSRNFSLEIYNFTGILKERDGLCDECHDLSNAMKINDSYYIKNLALLFGVKFKILSLMENDKLKIMGTIDIPFLPHLSHDSYLKYYNYGLNINYYLNDKASLSFAGRRMFDFGAFVYNLESSDIIPNLLTLNYCYNF